MSVTPGPYEAISEVTAGVFGPTKFYKLVNHAGKTIVDTLNSEVQEIVTEDEDRWDEQGRQDINAIARALECHDILVAALVEAKSFVGSLDRFIGTESTTGRVIRLALEKAQLESIGTSK